MHPGQSAGVLFAWVAGPLIRKHVLRVLSSDVYAVLHSIFCAALGFLYLIFQPPEKAQDVVLPAGLLCIMVAGSALGLGASFLLSELIRESANPGEVLAVLNALTTVFTWVGGVFVSGAPWDWTKAAGVCAIGGGLALMQ